jgi:hypothetical protein
MRDFHLFVPHDCVASNTPEQNQRALEEMRDVLKADIRSSEELDLSEMMVKASRIRQTGESLRTDWSLQ